MRLRRPPALACLLAFACIAVYAVPLAACQTTGQPTVTDPAGQTDVEPAPKNLNCAQEILQRSISNATARVNSVLAEAVSTGAAKEVALRNLTGLAAEVGPSALACAARYLTQKLGFDASHADTPEVRADYQRRADLARAFIAQEGYTFAGAPPGPPQ